MGPKWWLQTRLEHHGKLRGAPPWGAKEDRKVGREERKGMSGQNE